MSDGPFYQNRDFLWKEILLDLTSDVSTKIPLVTVPSTFRGVFPLEVVLFKDRVGGAFQTAPQIEIKAGNETSSGVIIAAIELTDVEGESQTLQPPTTSVKVATGGEDSYLFVNISTASVGQETASRARASNIATVVMAGQLAGVVAGEVVRVHGLGAGYDGLQTLLSISTDGETITFASVGANEATTVDTNGDVGIFNVRAFVKTLWW
jgi:hypothetical protein